MTGQAEEILLETALAYEHLFSQDSLKKWDINWATIYEKSPSDHSERDFCGA
jgi:hypothetical protein